MDAVLLIYVSRHQRWDPELGSPSVALQRQEGLKAASAGSPSFGFLPRRDPEALLGII